MWQKMKKKNIFQLILHTRKSDFGYPIRHYLINSLTILKIHKNRKNISILQYYYEKIYNCTTSLGFKGLTIRNPRVIFFQKKTFFFIKA